MGNSLFLTCVCVYNGRFEFKFKTSKSCQDFSQKAKIGDGSKKTKGFKVILRFQMTMNVCLMFHGISSNICWDI